MTSVQLSIFGPWIKASIRTNRYAWWALKREFHDGGLPAPIHFWATSFRVHVENFVNSLPPAKKQLLIDEWRKANKPELEIEEQDILDTYQHLIIEEVQRRAELAALRTIYW